jgi:uncharacterized protein YdaU (DUF1376 family)
MSRPFPLNADEWLSSARILAMPAAGEGAYIRLLLTAWNGEDGGLPDDDEQLHLMSRLSDSEWERLRPRLRRLFDSSIGDRIFNGKSKALWDKAHGTERKRAATAAKKQEEKIPRGPYGTVMLTTEEWQRLVASHGQLQAEVALQVLDCYFLVDDKRPRKYSSHYGCFHAWVFDSEIYRKKLAERMEAVAAAKTTTTCKQCGGPLSNMVCGKCKIDYTPKRR